VYTGKTLVYRVNVQVQPFQGQRSQENVACIRYDHRLLAGTAGFPADFHRFGQAVLGGGTVGAYWRITGKNNGVTSGPS
jgi:hypothetical protein